MRLRDERLKPVTRPDYPKEYPLCEACGHRSLHNVGAIGLCYTWSKATSDSCGCCQPKWSTDSAAILEVWKKYSQCYQEFIKYANAETFVERFREFFGVRSAIFSDSLIVNYADEIGYWDR